MRQDPTAIEPPGFTEYETEAAISRVPVRMMRFCWRNRHATIPLTMPFCLLAAAEALAHHPEPLWAEAAVAGLAGVVMWSAAPRKWSAEPRIKDLEWSSEVAYARATVISASAWLILAARYGPLTPAMEWALGILALGWGIPYWWHKRPRDKRARRRHAAAVAWWNTWWSRHATAWSVPGSHIEDTEESETVTSLLVQLVKGRQTLDHLKGSLRLVESALDEIDGGEVPQGQIRLERVSASRCWLHLKHDNPLREAIEWDPSMTPTDICQPAPLGTRESGELLAQCLRASFFVLGRSRSGKSNELSVMLATITGCRNARAFLIDMKGGRAARPWLPAMDWVATTTAEADLMMRCVLAEGKARAALAYNGHEQLTPTDEVPTLFLVIDETREVTAAPSGAEGATRRAAWLATIASQYQGVEIYVIDLTQYGSLEESLGTEVTRMNLNARMCFQTESRRHGTFALGDDAENLVDTTKLREKGTFYYRANAETMIEQIRGPHIPHSMVREIAAVNAARTQLHSRPLALYASDWQHVYNARWERLPEQFRADAPQAAHLAPPSPPGAAMTSPNKINSGQRAEHPEVTAINAEVDELPVTMDDVQRAAALRAARGEPPVDLRTEFDRRRHRFALAVQEAPAGGVTPREVKAACGLGRTWIHQELSALAGLGAVIKVSDGHYRAGGDIWEAMEAVDRDQARLAGEARELVGSAP